MGPIAIRIFAIYEALNVFIGLLFAVATIIFLWGVIRFIRSSADDAERRKSKEVITWGIVGLTIITAAWGIVTILINYFGIPQAPPAQLPPVQIKIK